MLLLSISSSATATAAVPSPASSRARAQRRMRRTTAAANVLRRLLYFRLFPPPPRSPPASSSRRCRRRPRRPAACHSTGSAGVARPPSSCAGLSPPARWSRARLCHLTEGDGVGHVAHLLRDGPLVRISPHSSNFCVQCVSPKVQQHLEN